MANRFLNNIRINDEYTLPSSDGTENQIIVTDGAGNLSFNDLGTITGAVNGVESNLIYYEVKNSSGSQILKGKGVMAVGTDGNSGHILIDEMVADGSVEARYFLGVLSETLNNGDIGRVIAFGELDQFNTNGQNGETWTNGQVLWCDPDSAGDFTITEPEGPNVKIPAAFILKASTNGKIQVRVQANEGLHQLHDTKITTQADGELLVWNNTLGVWQNDGTATIDYTNGRVGIGTTSPSYKLDVNGNTNITGTLNVTDGTDSVEMYYAGIIYKRNTSYLRPDGNGTRSLFIGGPSQSSADWNNVYVYTNGSNDFKWNDEVVATQTWVETNFAELIGDNVAYTNVDNNFSVAQSFGNVNISGVLDLDGSTSYIRDYQNELLVGSDAGAYYFARGFGANIAKSVQIGTGFNTYTALYGQEIRLENDTNITGTLDVSGIISGDGRLLNRVFYASVYEGNSTNGFLIETDIVTNNYALIHGRIMLEQFNFSTKQTIEFSATALNTGTLVSYKGTSDIQVTIKMFNYNGKWYIHVPAPSTFTSCTAYIGLANGYQGQIRNHNEIANITVATIPATGVTNSVDIIPEVIATQEWALATFSELAGDNVAFTNINNNFTTGQTINGGIVSQGSNSALWLYDRTISEDSYRWVSAAGTLSLIRRDALPVSTEITPWSVNSTGNHNFGSGTATFGADVTISNGYPRINLYSTDLNEDDWSIINNNGSFGIWNTTDSSYRYQIDSSGNHNFYTGTATFGGLVTVNDGDVKIHRDKRIYFTQPSDNGNRAFIGSTDGLNTGDDAADFNSLVFGVSASIEAGRILGDGKWLLGFTSNQNSSKLQVSGSGYFSSSLTATTFNGNWNSLATTDFVRATGAIDQNITGNKIFDNNVTITGNLIVNGSQTTVNTELTTADSVIKMNDGEVGAGVTLGYSGFQIDRGTQDDFWFGYDEVRDRFTVGKITGLTAPQIATTQVLATRSDSLTDQTIVIWDNTAQKLVNSGHLATELDNLAYTNVNNNFSVNQTAPNFIGNVIAQQITNASTSAFQIRTNAGTPIATFGNTLISFYDDTDITGTLDVSGLVTANGSVKIPDNQSLFLGTDNDLRLWSTNTNTYIQSSLNNLYIQNLAHGGQIYFSLEDSLGNAHTAIRLLPENGQVYLQFDDSVKLKTTSTGIDVVGLTDTDTFNVSGVSTFSGSVTINNSLWVTGGNSQFFSNTQDVDYGTLNDLVYRNEALVSGDKRAVILRGRAYLGASGSKGGEFLLYTRNNDASSFATYTFRPDNFSIPSSLLVPNNIDVRGVIFNGTGDVRINDNLDVDFNLNVDGTATFGGVTTINSTSDQKLILRASAGDTTEWNYMAFLGTDGVRDGYFGVDSAENLAWYRDTTTNAIYLLADGNNQINGNTHIIGDLSVTGTIIGGTLDVNSSGTFGGKVTVNNEIESDIVRIKSDFSGGVGIILDRTENASVDSLFYVGVSHNGSTTSDFMWLGTSTSDFNISGTGNVGIGTTSPSSSAKLTIMGNQTFGLPGNGSNTSGRFLSIEGNTDASGEGSGRIFFTEHNSTTASMSNYGMSIGYRGGSTSIVGADGNTWTGLSQIGNGQWGMWGHDNDAAGALIMYGDRAATYINFAANNLNNIGNLDVTGNIIVNPYKGFSNSGSWTRNATPYGYIDFGPANINFAHIYTDRPAFYFNKQLQVLGNTVWNAGNDGAGSGLDADTLDGQHASAFQPAGTYNTIIGTDSDINTSGSTIIDNIYVTDGVITSMGTRTLTPGDIGAAYYDHFRSLGVPAFTAGGGSNSSTTTSQLITEMENDGAFDSYTSAFKTSWSYASNDNLTDAGRFTETAGTSWLTWTDNSSDSTRGNITALAIAPNTGGSAGKVFIYNDQGSGYSPGWREVWTSTSDGSGSGLDADLLDGQHGSYYATASHNHDSDYVNVTGDTMTGNLSISKNNPVLILNETTSTSDADQVAYISFQDNGAEEAWIGWGSNGNSNLTIRNSIGSVVLDGNGTTQINDNLDLNGNADISGTVKANIFYDRNNTAYYIDGDGTSKLNHLGCSSTLAFGAFTAGSRGTIFEGYSTHSVVRTDSARLDFYMGKTTTGVGTMMSLTDTGNVGIGTTTPTGKLEVVTVDSNRYIRFKAPNGEERFQFYTGGTGNPAGLYMYSEDGTTRNVQISAGGTSYFNGGNVGIGTTTPSDGDLNINDPKLHVQGPTTSGSYHLVSRFQAGNDSDNTGAAIAINHSNDRGLLIKAGRKDSDRPVAYFDLIDSNGSTTNLLTMGEYGSDFRVGIGTTSPSEKLDVDGNIKVSGTGTFTKGAFSPATAASVSSSVFTLDVEKQVSELFLSNGNYSISNTISNISNTAGLIITIIILQDSTGSRTITSWGTGIEFGDAGAPTLSTGANKMDMLSFYSDGNKLFFMGIQKGFSNYTLVTPV